MEHGWYRSDLYHSTQIIISLDSLPGWVFRMYYPQLMILSQEAEKEIIMSSTTSSLTKKAIAKTDILSTYRTLLRLIKLLPKNQNPQQQWQHARQIFHKNSTLTDESEIRSCLQQAGEKIAYLRIVTPKKSSTKSSSGNMRWIYTKDGPVPVGGSDNNSVKGTLRDGRRVVSNWDGSNLDPCSVKIHNAQLKRMGFVNNLHAKGLF